MPSYSKIILAKYPDASPVILGESGGNFMLQDRGMGAGLEIVLWDLPDPQPTLAELDQWAADHQAEILAPIRQALKDSLDVWLSDKRQQLAQEAKFTADKLTEWWWKRTEYVSWLAADQPEITLANHPGAVIEAYYAGKTPEYLMAEWGANNSGYEQIMIVTMAFRAQQRALIAIANEAGLAAMGDWEAAYQLFLANYAGQPWLA